MAENLERQEPQTILVALVVVEPSKMRLVELALLEATVHYLDLSAALGSGADLSSEVMHSVAETLMSMTTPQVLIEVATGRRQASEVFPVHS